jgi:hypothetical protein
MRAQSSDSAKHVSSKNELCSEYGTPKSCADGVEPREGRRCACVNSRCGGCARTEAMEGAEVVPAGGEYLWMRDGQWGINARDFFCSQTTTRIGGGMRLTSIP